MWTIALQPLEHHQIDAGHENVGHEHSLQTLNLTFSFHPISALLYVSGVCQSRHL